MHMKRLFAGLVILCSLAGDGLVPAVGAACDLPGSASRIEASCCCGPESCPAKRSGEPGLQAACCEMGQPTRSPEPPVAPRESPASPVSIAFAAVAAPVLAEPSALSRITVEQAPSLHSPPLFELYRSYRN